LKSITIHVLERVVAGSGFFCLELGHKFAAWRQAPPFVLQILYKQSGDFLKPSVEELIAAKELNTEGFCVH
jgi:hypothetical protein